MAKAGSSRSPLGRPQTLIHRWAVEVQEYLYLPDPSPFYITLGAVAANMMTGNPTWLLLLGPSGCGKSICIDSIKLLPNVKSVEKFEGLASMMSGSSKKDKVRGATGGWLFELGQRGLVSCKEFTSTLTQSTDKLAEALGMLRSVGDGSYDRPVGSDGGKRITWEGSIGFVGASTSALDQYARQLGELGQRWVLYRFSGHDGYESGMRILSTKDPAAAIRRISEITKELFESLSMEWSCYYNCENKPREDHRCSTGPTRREITLRESRRIVALAMVASRARSIVPRDPRSRDIVGRPDIESPNRIVAALGQLLLGLETLGLDEAEIWGLLTRVAWDSISPESRAILLGVLRGHGAVEQVRLNLADAQKILDIDLLPTRIVVSDLRVLGLIEHPRGSTEFWLSPWCRDEMIKWK